MSFQNLDDGYCRPGLPKKCQFMGEPKTEYDFPTERDYGTMHPWRPGPHKICRIYGFCLKWDEVEDGMTVKLKTKDPNFKTYDVLYAGRDGKHSYGIIIDHNLKILQLKFVYND